MAGESEVWREWLARHGPALVLFARQWTPCAADAEDAVQEGFIRFWRARGRARGVGYLYACVRAAAVDLARTDQARRRRIESSALHDSVISAFSPEHAELAAAVESSLAQLPAEQREVVVMKIWGGLTFAQIGQALSVSPNTAASRYRYALDRLEIALADEVTRE